MPYLAASTYPEAQTQPNYQTYRNSPARDAESGANPSTPVLAPTVDRHGGRSPQCDMYHHARCVVRDRGAVWLIATILRLQLNSFYPSYRP
jgi:hypothetical protein